MRILTIILFMQSLIVATFLKCAFLFWYKSSVWNLEVTAMYDNNN